MATITTECGHAFPKPAAWPQEIEGATADCSECGALLLLVSNTHAALFHKEMNRRDPQWPADGKDTGYVEIGDES